MITINQASSLRRGDEIITVTADRTYVWRVNGQIKLWKTRPNEFKLPIKHGLYTYGYLTHENAHYFSVI